MTHIHTNMHVFPTLLRGNLNSNIASRKAVSIDELVKGTITCRTVHKETYFCDTHSFELLAFIHCFGQQFI